MPMRDVCLKEMYACERCTPIRDVLVRCMPIGDACL
jgi:hypothetical protein